MDEPTAWEEINPPMVSAPQGGQLSEYLGRLQPATNDQFRDELEACLALVVPVGMNEEARAEWLAVAWETLKHLPDDMLVVGCRKARETCDHPSKIVPAIVRETADWYESRSSVLRVPAESYTPEPRQLAAPDQCTPEQAREILREEGLNSPLARQILAAIEGNIEDIAQPENMRRA